MMMLMTTKPRKRDASKPRRYKIIRDDLVHANPGEPTSCALARSIERHGQKPAVGAGVVWIEEADGTRVRYILSPKDQAIIRAFDDSSIFPTVTVTLLPPAPSQRLGARRGEAHGSDRRSGTAPTHARHIERQASRHGGAGLLDG